MKATDILIPDEIMSIGPKDCKRCGQDERYHDKSRGVNYIPCIRSKPYKLADKADLQLGMTVYYYHPYDPITGRFDVVNGTMIRGMVRFIHGQDGLRLWKYPCDRHNDPDKLIDLAHDIPMSINRCFTSLEGAERYKADQIAYYGKLGTK